VAHDISMMASFVQIRDLNDDCFCWVIKFQVSVMVGFGGLRDLNDCR